MLASVLENHRLVDNVPSHEIRRGAQRTLQSIIETLQDFPSVEA